MEERSSCLLGLDFFGHFDVDPGHAAHAVQESGCGSLVQATYRSG